MADMLVKTKYFGEIEMNEEEMIVFDNGILGFPELKKYVLLYDIEKEGRTIRWLQSCDEQALSIPVIIPTLVMPDYNPTVEDELLKGLGELTDENLSVLVTVTVPEDVTKMTANMKAPIIINADTLKGCQLIVENQEYEVRYQIFDILKNRKEG